MVFFTSRGIVDSETAIGDLDVETQIRLNENGVPTNYLIVHQGIPGSMYDASCDGSWCLRVDLSPDSQSWDSENINAYAPSSVNEYLNGSWMNRYDENVLNQIKQVKIPYCAGNANQTIYSGANGLSVKCFLPGYAELGISDEIVDGAKLDYFDFGTTSQKRVAKQNGASKSWATRTPQFPSGGAASMVGFIYSSTGGPSSYYASNDAKPRPMIILPFDFKLTDDQIVS